MGRVYWMRREASMHLEPSSEMVKPDRQESMTHWAATQETESVWESEGKQEEKLAAEIGYLENSRETARTWRISVQSVPTGSPARGNRHPPPEGKEEGAGVRKPYVA
jgi:hypothetical protein